MQVPVTWRNASFLPVLPARILFDSRPNFLRRERDALREAPHCTRHVHANKHAANIENDGLDLRTDHRSMTVWAARARQPDDGRENRKQDDGADDEMKIFANVGDARAQQIASQNHASDPKDAAKNVKEQISRIGHSCGASHRGAKRADNRNEPRQYHCPAAILLIEFLRTLQVSAAKQK